MANTDRNPDDAGCDTLAHVEPLPKETPSLQWLMSIAASWLKVANRHSTTGCCYFSVATQMMQGQRWRILKPYIGSPPEEHRMDAVRELMLSIGVLHTTAPEIRGGKAAQAPPKELPANWLSVSHPAAMTLGAFRQWLQREIDEFAELRAMFKGTDEQVYSEACNLVTDARAIVSLLCDTDCEVPPALVAMAAETIVDEKGDDRTGELSLRACIDRLTRMKLAVPRSVDLIGDAVTENAGAKRTEASGDKPSDPPSNGNRGRYDPEVVRKVAEAMFIRCQEPDISETKLATRVGVPRTTLRSNKQYQDFAEAFDSGLPKRAQELAGAAMAAVNRNAEGGRPDPSKVRGGIAADVRYNGGDEMG